MPGRFAFLPNARTAIAAAARAPSQGATRLSLTYDVEIQANNSAAAGVPRIPVGGEMRGPGDVVGFNRQVISRTEPEQGLRATEPHYFPFLEFRETDFPWRFSLDTGTGTRIKPWIVLLALQPDEFEFVPPGRAPFTRIRVTTPAASLPSLAESWAHAHVHVAVSSTTTVADAIAKDPAAHFARLLCPRRLAERTAYHLFLVPAYEAGRRAGIGMKLDASPAYAFDAPAWTLTTAAPLELPVYFQTRFTTNELEDVEMLLRRLRGLTANELAAIAPTRLASARNPGYYAGYEAPGQTFELQGALRRPGSTVQPYNTEATLASQLITTLQEVIAGEQVGANADGPNVPDPLVAMPPYGWRFRPSTTLQIGRAQQDAWFDRTNLDLKFRHAAGLGAEVVRRDQELFAARAWEQYEEVVEANRKLQNLQYAEKLVARVTNQRIAKLAADVVLALAEPLQPYTLVQDSTLLDAVQRSGTPTSYLSRALRKVAAKRPVHVRDRQGAVRVEPAMPPAPGDRARRMEMSRGTREVPSAQPFVDEFQPHVRELLGDHAFETARRARRPAVAVQELDGAQLTKAVTARITALPSAKAVFVVTGRVGAEQAVVQPVFRSPIIPLPLANKLVDIDANHLIPGIDALPQNTVAALEESRRFIESFLVGANHAMNQELRWREFPTDMRGTIFRRFWDRGLPASDTAGDDIAEIHTWTGKLGTHFAPGAPNHEADLVIVIRGDIIRKLGQLIVVINEAAGQSWTEGQGTDYEPVFFGRVGADVAYYGFDVSRQHILSQGVRDRTFLVLYEPMGRLRFGLDIGSVQVRQQRRVYEKLTLEYPLASLKRSYDTVPARAWVGGAAPPAQAATWDDLSWSHVPQAAGGYVDFSKQLVLAGQPDYWGAQRTSASLARAFWQKPVAAVLPLSRIL